MNEELNLFNDFIKKNKRRSMAIIEIGAGPVQPMARELGRTRFLNDKYKGTLISINPIKERLGHYKSERG